MERIPEPELTNRIGAFLLSLADPLMERTYGSLKGRLFEGHPEMIVEIGPGAGINFRYYRPGTRVIALEPNRAQHDRLRRKAAEHQLILDVRGGKAESIDLDDSSIPMAVSTLVMCSVKDPLRVAEEIYRVLEPGGRFVFIEHVAALQGSSLRKWQSRLRGPWSKVFGGCTIDRESAATIVEAGFEPQSLESFQVGPRWLPVSPHVMGVMVKRGW